MRGGDSSPHRAGQSNESPVPAAPHPFEVKFIGIDGHGGSGKSTLAELLSKKLEAEVIHTDDFASFDDPLNWWPLVIERIFKPIQNGAKTMSYPRSKWWEDHHPKPVVDQPVTPIMILEGVSALRKEFRPYLSYGIFIETPLEICFKRGMERDKGRDGKADEEIELLWDDWFKTEQKYMDRDNPKDCADAVFDGTKNFEEQIEKLGKNWGEL